jgi:hypothetical protein
MKLQFVQDQLVPVNIYLRTSIITKKQKRDLKKIILVKSVTILEGEDVGFERRRKDVSLQYHFRKFYKNYRRVIIQQQC